MEDVLDVYQRPYDPAKPVICLDETSRQLIEETRVTLPTQPGKTAKVDYECESRVEEQGPECGGNTAKDMKKQARQKMRLDNDTFYKPKKSTNLHSKTANL